MKFATTLTIALAFLACASVRADIILSHGVTYSQDFNTLTSSPDGGTSSTLPNSPNGWTFVETGNGNNSLYTIGNGSSGTSDTYSFGSTGSTDRALGSIGNVAPQPRTYTMGARFQNIISNPKPFTRVMIGYTGEQWRLGATGRLDKLDFQISTDATSLTTGNWMDVNALDFTAPVTAGSTGALDGNLAVNRTIISTIKIALPSAVSPGQAFWIRWNSLNVSGPNDGLAIDDFSVTAIPEPSSMVAFGSLLLMLAWYIRRRNRRQSVLARA